MNLHTANSNGIDGKSFVACQGTITNLTRLQQELKLPNATPDDTIHAAFMTWNLDFLDHLEGTFALAVFDLDNNRLILARDRFGTIPLYYTADRTVAFASRTDDFLQKDLVPRTASLQAIWDYLTLGAVPQPNTIIAGVHSIPPATLATIDLTTHAVTHKTWWSLRQEAKTLTTDGMTMSDAARQVRQLLNDSLTQLIPYLKNARLLLSGGIDSTVILNALTSLDGPVNTLTIGFESKHASFNETEQACRFAKAAGATHQTIIVNDWELSKNFPKFIKNMDQPSRDGLNVFLAAKAAREDGAEAIVTGLGGDELFAGYPHVLRHLKAERLAPKLALLRPLLRKLGDSFRHNLMLPALTRPERLETLRAQLYEQGKRQVVNPQLLQGKALVPWLKTCQEFSDDTLDCLHQDLLFDLSLDVDHTLLRDTFLQTEGNQLKAFAPMLDHSLAALAFALPANLLQQKRILLAAYQDLLPQELLSAPKRGFQTPFLHWLGSTLLPRAREAFNSPQAKTLFVQQHRLNWSYRLSSLQPRDYPLWSRFVLLQYLMSRNITSFS